jgi:anti-sigma-K factor RskA
VNIKEYISSGILEAYVMGELNDHERAQVERNLELFPELQNELEKIEEVQERLLMGSAMQPRATVKKELFQKIDQQSPEVKSVPAGKERSMVFWKFAAAASVSVALITSYLAYDYRNKWVGSSNQLSDLLAQNQRIAQDYNQVNQRLDSLTRDVNVLTDPQFQRIVMKGTANAPEALASVYWNESTKEVYLRIQNMKALSQNQQYQLWAIIDGKPVDAGVFDGNVASLLKMKEIGTGAVTFAVTVETRGGKQSPTLETMQVAGNVIKG